MKKLTLFLLAALFSLIPAATSYAGIKYVAVVETEVDAQSGAAAKINKAEVREVTTVLRNEARNTLPSDIYKIMTSETVIAQGGAVLEECAEENCVITLGSKIGADYIVRGTIGKVGTKLTLSILMYETEDGTLVGSARVSSEKVETLLDKAATACSEMYKKFDNETRATGATRPPSASTQTSASPAASTYRQSNVDANGTLTDGGDGKKYKTAVIGAKRWMAENLNYRPQPGKSWCYDDDNSYCDELGRLYDWNTAKNACPAGWHLPSRGEWDSLCQAAGGKKDPDKNGNIMWRGASKKLKSRDGWAFYTKANLSGNGTDDFGFSALPGGSRYSGDTFNNAGVSGGWWTATEYSDGKAYVRYMNAVDDITGEYADIKERGYSVRCLADTSSGTITDGRDGKKYKITVIGGKRWMAENLNYQTAGGSWCYDNENYNCDKYGRLYNWMTAVNACPSGWHLPLRREWKDLMNTVGAQNASKKLKAKNGWNDAKNRQGNGTDDYGFSALPGGNRSQEGSFEYIGYNAHWWTATESSDGNAYLQTIYYNEIGSVMDYDDYKYGAYSVRCVED